MREYGIAAPGLASPEPVVTRRSAERLAAVVPGAHVVVRYGNVENGFLGTGYRAGRWIPLPEGDGTQARAETAASAGSAASSSGVPVRERRRVSVRRAGGRAECSVTFAPETYPYVWVHEWLQRSPVLVLRAENARVELDLEDLAADDALTFIAELRAALNLYAEQWEAWESRAEFDQAGPYPIPPLVYGNPGDTSDDVPAQGVRESGDVPGGSGGGA